MLSCQSSLQTASRGVFYRKPRYHALIQAYAGTPVYYHGNAYVASTDVSPLSSIALLRAVLEPNQRDLCESLSILAHHLSYIGPHFFSGLTLLLH